MTWRQHAACKDMGPEAWFQDDVGYAGYRQARKVCASCPVQTECLDENLHEVYGMWGGTTPKERQRMRGGHGTVDDQIVRLARAGLQDIDIAERLGMNVKTVARRRYQAGIRKVKGHNTIREDVA